MTQYATPDLIGAVVYEGHDPGDDPAWRDSGATTRTLYSRWSRHLSGIAALRMALLHRDGQAPTLFELLAGARRHQAYVEDADGRIGLNFTLFADYMRISHALPADVHSEITMDDVVDLLDSGHMVMASVSKENDLRPKRDPGKIEEHLLLAIGHQAGYIHFRNPAGPTKRTREAVLPISRFAAHLGGQGLSLDLPGSPRPYTPPPLDPKLQRGKPQNAQELAARMRERIEDGRWASDQLYTKSQLAGLFDVAQETVKTALAILRHEGLVETRSKIGTRPKIANRSWNPADDMSRSAYITHTLRARITEGAYPAGETLPSQLELTREFEVTRSVIQYALEPLKSDGLITRSPSNNRFVVTAGTRPKMGNRSWNPADDMSRSAYIAHTLRARITEGTYPAGETLPSQVELAREFKVVRSVIQYALEPLKSNGLITRSPSNNRFVVTAVKSEESAR
ncbi:GntR family transcriptional regulator [Streptomyces misionensis]|uniref:GntR family transcriptional regulator n=1 Tax=Streptomyces misionensis TaxID=67331 RepID=UPI0033E8FC2A